MALLAQTCNSIGLPDLQQNTKVKSNSNSENNSTKTDKSNKDDTKGYKTSSQADSTSDGIELVKCKESPTEKKSSDSRHRNATIVNEDSNKNDSASISSSVGNLHETTATSSSDSKISIAHTQIATSPTLASTSKCGTCVTPGYPPHVFSHYFPPTSAPGFPYVHGLPSLPLSCYPGFPSGSMPVFPRLCTDPFCKSCPPNPNIPLNPSTLGGTGTRPCPLGCTQCTTHPTTDLSLWLNSYSLLNAGFHGFTNPMMPSLAAAPNSAALMAAAAAAANPFVGHFPQNVSGQNGPPTCWWNSGEGYCLKKFATSEELLQHLRTHTHESANKSVKSPSAPGGLPSVSGRMSPRSTSYLNSLSSFRYHPYNKLSPTPTGVPSSSTLPIVQFPTLNSAYGMQSLFAGQRIPGSLPHQ